MKITRKSPLTGETNTMDIDVTPDQMDAWARGKRIQTVMPNLTAGEREFILSGYTPEDWRIIFGAAMSYTYEGFEISSEEESYVFDVEIIITMLSRSTGRGEDYVPADFEIESVELVPRLDHAPRSATIKLTETQFSWLHPEADAIINNAYEWAADNEADFL